MQHQLWLQPTCILHSLPCSQLYIFLSTQTCACYLRATAHNSALVSKEGGQCISIWTMHLEVQKGVKFKKLQTLQRLISEGTAVKWWKHWRLLIHITASHQTDAALANPAGVPQLPAMFQCIPAVSLQICTLILRHKQPPIPIYIISLNSYQMFWNKTAVCGLLFGVFFSFFFFKGSNVLNYKDIQNFM